MRRRYRAGDRNDYEVEKRRPWRADLRRAQWSSYFHRFFAGGRYEDPIPGKFAPISLDDAVDRLHRAYAEQKRYSEAHLVRRCMSQMAKAGYRPTGSAKAKVADLIAQTSKASSAVAEVAPPAPAAPTDPLSLIFGTPLPGEFVRRVPLSIEEQFQQAGDLRRSISVPAQISHSGLAFQFEKRGYYRVDPKRADGRADGASSASHLVDPRNWTQLGEFFALTKRDDKGKGGTPDEPSWQGVLREDFVSDWNGSPTQVFHQKLRVDYTVFATGARADYSLMYEEDDQVSVNEGYFEVRDVEDQPGWVGVTMTKTVRFTSSILNLLAPAIFSMFLDSAAGGFNDFFEV